MKALYDGNMIDVDDAGAAAVAVLERESARWTPIARVDVFDLDSVAECREHFGLDHEPISTDLFRWARLTKDLPLGAVMLDPTTKRLFRAISPKPGDPAFGDDVNEVEGNLLTRLGLARLGNLFIGATGAASQALNAAHMRLGVGDSNTAAATTDTDLGAASGSTHRQYKLVDSVAQGTGANSGVTTAVATFGTGVANFASGWLEWGADGGTGDGTTVTSETASTPGLCNHKIPGAALIVKTSSVVAVFTATLTIA